MAEDRNLIIIRDLIRSKFENVKIYLFGSRTRNDNRFDSDYDLLVVLDKELSSSEKIGLSSLLRRELAQSAIDADILVKSPTDVADYVDKIGCIIHSALQGIAL